MKRMKFYMLLSALLCAFSCGDNNEPYDERHYGFEGIYPILELGRELILVYNGDTLTNKTVDFTTHRGLKNGVLTFENVIQGEAKTVLKVELIEDDSSFYSDSIIIIDYKLLFEGIYYTKSRSIRYSGIIRPWLMLLELNEE